MAQYGAMYIIQLHLASRGRERMDTYLKSDFQVLWDEDKGLNFWKLVNAGETKNNKLTDQDIENGGRIYFEENAGGLNPGQYLQDYMSKLSDDHKNLMQRPQRTAEWFKLKDNPKCW